MFRRVLGVGVVVACVALLSSCALLPPSTIIDDSGQQAEVQMQHIADAVKHHDAAALKRLFSPVAREKATDLDGGLNYFLSFFRSGRMTWKSLGTATSEHDANWKQSMELFARYKVSADGKEYELYFSDFTVNQVQGRNNVGVYSLAVAPYTADPITASGKSKPFFAWQATGTPGVYVPQG